MTDQHELGQHVQRVGLHVHAGSVGEVLLQVLEGAGRLLEALRSHQQALWLCPVLYMDNQKSSSTLFVSQIHNFDTAFDVGSEVCKIKLRNSSPGLLKLSWDIKILIKPVNFT